ncbi:MAG: class I SAM-dependent methyltransferase [Balneolales bacterium]
MNTQQDINCPLCLQKGPFEQVEDMFNRVHYHCPNCMLVFADPKHHLSGIGEKERYLEHNNGIQYPGYVRFLNQAIDPTLPYLNNSMNGLDYGCGPGPTLSLLLKRQGISCEDYDPIFFPKELNSTYDFIFATECFEHFFNPDEELKRLKKLLSPGGIITIMTIQWANLEDFPSWHYAKDPTHVSFFHPMTFRFICNHYGFELLPSNNKRVIILKKIR